MKHEVDKLIFNVLLSQGEVWIPDVGSLILCRHAARQLSAKRLVAPYRELLFTAERRGVSLVEIIASTADVAAERAEAICHEWVVQSSTDGVVTIEGVCRIEGRQVVAEEGFEKIVNPQGRVVVELHPRRSVGLVALVVVSIVLALCAVGYGLYVFGVVDSAPAAKSADVAVASSADSVVEVAESGDGVDTLPCDAPAVTSNVETSVATPVEQSKVEPIVEVKTDAVVETEPKVADKSNDIYKVHPLTRGSYVVWGVYREKKNADEAVDWLKRRYSDLDITIYTYGKRYMVSLCKTKTRSECNRHIRALRGRAKAFADVWAYTK